MEGGAAAGALAAAPAAVVDVAIFAFEADEEEAEAAKGDVVTLCLGLAEGPTTATSDEKGERERGRKEARERGSRDDSGGVEGRNVAFVTLKEADRAIGSKLLERKTLRSRARARAARARAARKSVKGRERVGKGFFLFGERTKKRRRKQVRIPLIFCFSALFLSRLRHSMTRKTPSSGNQKSLAEGESPGRAPSALSSLRERVAGSSFFPGRERTKEEEKKTSSLLNFSFSAPAPHLSLRAHATNRCPRPYPMATTGRETQKESEQRRMIWSPIVVVVVAVVVDRLNFSPLALVVVLLLPLPLLQRLSMVFSLFPLNVDVAALFCVRRARCMCGWKKQLKGVRMKQNEKEKWKIDEELEGVQEKALAPQLAKSQINLSP